MQQVAKILVIDETGRCLMMRRSDHPAFPDDPDLPGGIMEEGESPRQAALRELAEETGITLTPEADIKELYQGNAYSAHGTVYTLYAVRLDKRPEVVITWEHAAYQWLASDEFLNQARGAADSYMHMVAEVLETSCSAFRQSG